MTSFRLVTQYLSNPTDTLRSRKQHLKELKDVTLITIQHIEKELLLGKETVEVIDTELAQLDKAIKLLEGIQ